MINAIGGLSLQFDAEYQRIIQELLSLGITPSGNKAVDAAKLAHAKAELVNKIKAKQTAEANANLQVQTIEPADAAEKNVQTEMEEQRLGAMNIAELMRLYHKI